MVVSSFLLLSLVLPVVQAPGGDGFTAEQKEVFALLDEFDPLDTASLPFVKVAMGSGFSRVGEPRQNSYRCGFLLDADGKQFRVRFVDLDKALLTNTPAGTPEYWRVGFEPADLRSVARKVAERMRASQEDEEWRFHLRPGDPIHLRPGDPTPEVVTLLVARACARSGMRREVEALWQALPEEMRSKASLVRGRSSLLVGSDFEQRLVRDFGDPTLSWTDLLASHEKWLATFQDDETARKWVAARRDLAAAMVEEERRHPRLSAEPTVDELIRDLRNAFRPTQTFSYGVRSMPLPDRAPASATRAFDELVRRGLDVVPALIAVTGDKTPTRSVDLVNGMFHLRDLGDLAGDVIKQIDAAEVAGNEPKVEGAKSDERARTADSGLEAWRNGHPPDCEELQFLLESGTVEVWQRLLPHLDGAVGRHDFAVALYMTSGGLLATRFAAADRATAVPIRTCLLRLLADPTPLGEGRVFARR